MSYKRHIKKNKKALCGNSLESSFKEYIVFGGMCSECFMKAQELLKKGKAE